MTKIQITPNEAKERSFFTGFYSVFYGVQLPFFLFTLL